MPNLVLVRHSVPEQRPNEIPSQWRLSDQGRARAASIGARVRAAISDRPATGAVSSAETKAIETGELLAVGSVRVDHRLGEIRKPWYDSPDDLRQATFRYLTGHAVPGWEDPGDALGRFDAAMSALIGKVSVVITHGTVLTLWLSRRVGELDPQEFWTSLQMPDAFLFDSDTQDLRRIES